ncbi:MAG: HEAT repeat domain-containing protein [Verrucomicrobiota bacterium]
MVRKLLETAYCIGMSKPRRIALFVGLLLMIALLVFAATRPREPVDQGKTLSAWLEEINFAGPQRSSTELQFAIRRMGTNTLPFLLPRLRFSKTDAKVKFEEWARKQDVFPILFHDNERECYAAALAFEFLGPIAKPAIPSLEKMLDEKDIDYGVVTDALSFIGTDAIPSLTNTWFHPNAKVRKAGFNSLVEMRTNAASAVPFLVAALKDSDPEIRGKAAFSMWSVGRTEQAIAIPALIRTLEDPDLEVQVAAIDALGWFGKEAETVVPKLAEFLGRKETTAAAMLALVSMMGKTESIPLLTKALTNQNAAVQSLLINQLGDFQSDAQAVVPALLPFARGENKRLRHAAVHALIQIGAEPEVMVPILVTELADTDRWIRSDVLGALASLGPKATAAESILSKQIEVQIKNHGGISVQGNYALRSEEFDTLQKIDPVATDKIRKRFEEEKAKATKEKK